MADLVHLSSSASSEEIIDVLNKDAGVIIDNLLHSDDISRINQDLKPYLKNDVFGRDEFTGFKFFIEIGEFGVVIYLGKLNHL